MNIIKSIRGWFTAKPIDDCQRLSDKWSLSKDDLIGMARTLQIPVTHQANEDMIFGMILARLEADQLEGKREASQLLFASHDESFRRFLYDRRLVQYAQGRAEFLWPDKPDEKDEPDVRDEWEVVVWQSIRSTHIVRNCCTEDEAVEVALKDAREMLPEQVDEIDNEDWEVVY